jgi:hypothetical protein
MPPGSRPAVLLLAAYAALSLVILGVWTVGARTELRQFHTTLEREIAWNSVVELAQGTAPKPFLKRRLLPDAARLVAGLVPAAAWEGLERALASDRGLARAAAAGLARLGWKPEHYPVLFSAHALIGLSILGFIYVARWWVAIFYDTPGRVRDVVGALLGMGLLGGLWRLGAYPYDVPHALVFALTLGAVITGRWWAIPCFALAAYSKETAVLIIPACWLLAENRRAVDLWARMIALGAIFVAVQLWIDLRYPGDFPPGEPFWWPWYNLFWMAKSLVYHAWWVPVVVVCAYRIARVWDRVPTGLRRLALLIPLLLAVTFFKGWLEERRQYLELLPVGGLILLQWMAIELGVGHWMRPREGRPAGAAPDLRPLPGLDAPAAARLEPVGVSEPAGSGRGWGARGPSLTRGPGR